MYNIEKSQFQSCLKREKKIVFNEDIACEVIFRKNSTKNYIDDYLTIFYDVNTNIKIGDILKYSDYNLLVLNVETIENNSYKSSNLLKCNQNINLGYDTTIIDDFTGNEIDSFLVTQENIPCFINSSLNNQSETQIGTIDETESVITISAKTPLANSQIIQVKSFLLSNNNTTVDYKKYTVESIDTSNVVFSDNQYFGIIFAQITLKI